VPNEANVFDDVRQESGKDWFQAPTPSIDPAGYRNYTTTFEKHYN